MGGYLLIQEFGESDLLVSQPALSETNELVGGAGSVVVGDGNGDVVSTSFGEHMSN
jgi:hypothetical protein